MKKVREMPGYYTEPQDYAWWLIETPTGYRRTVAKGKAAAYAKAVQNGYTVKAVRKLRDIKT